MPKGPITTLALGLLCLGLGSSCANENQNQDIAALEGCKIPDEQASSFYGRWNATPIPVAFAASRWNDTEKAAAIAAMKTWNKFYKSAKGFELFSWGSDSNPDEVSQQHGNLNCGGIPQVLQGNQFVGKVVIYKRESWNIDANRDQKVDTDLIAVTGICSNSGKDPLNQIYSAEILVNYEHFFVTSQKPDLESIFLHELGHLIGLKHSCNPSGEEGVPECSGSAETSYVDAVMYATVGINSAGESSPRRGLKRNDKYRAACLYYDR